MAKKVVKRKKDKLVRVPKGMIVSDQDVDSMSEKQVAIFFKKGLIPARLISDADIDRLSLRK